MRAVRNLTPMLTLLALFALIPGATALGERVAPAGLAPEYAVDPANYQLQPLMPEAAPEAATPPHAPGTPTHPSPGTTADRGDATSTGIEKRHVSAAREEALDSERRPIIEQDDGAHEPETFEDPTAPSIQTGRGDAVREPGSLHRALSAAVDTVLAYLHNVEAVQ